MAVAQVLVRCCSHDCEKEMPYIGVLRGWYLTYPRGPRHNPRNLQWKAILIIYFTRPIRFHPSTSHSLTHTQLYRISSTVRPTHIHLGQTLTTPTKQPLIFTTSTTDLLHLPMTSHLPHLTAILSLHFPRTQPHPPIPFSPVHLSTTSHCT